MALNFHMRTLLNVLGGGVQAEMLLASDALSLEG